MVGGRFSSNTAFITIEGVGTREEQQVSHIIDTNIYIRFPYNTGTRNILVDIWRMRMDAKEQSDFHNPSIKKRHSELVNVIKGCLNAYKNVVLTGLSHGSLIMYKAILQIMHDISFKEYPTTMSKISFFPISCPVPLPPHFLQGDAYCRVYGYNDPLYKGFYSVLANVFGANASSIYTDKCLKNAWDKAPAPLFNLYDTKRNIMFSNDPTDKKWATDKIPSDWVSHCMKSQLSAYPPNLHANNYFAHGVMPYMANFYLYQGFDGQTGGRIKIRILGRERLVITKSKRQYVKYKGELITLRSAMLLEKQKSTQNR
jgi:hypothetical protein